jgi:hypothetical protein
MIGALVYGILTLVLGPRHPAAPVDTRPGWRMYLRGGATLDIYAESEGHAVRELLRKQIPLASVIRMEDLP